MKGLLSTWGRRVSQEAGLPLNRETGAIVGLARSPTTVTAVIELSQNGAWRPGFHSGYRSLYEYDHWIQVWQACHTAR